MARRTKIVATLGPQSRNGQSLRELIAAGVDVVRLNLSHDTIDTHRGNAALARSVAGELGRVVGLLVDLPGPKMRTGPLTEEAVHLASGNRYVLTAAAGVPGDECKVSTSLCDLAGLVQIGDEVILGDGAIVLRVRAIDGDDVCTEVVHGGTLRSGKGLHLPSSDRATAPFSTVDEHALRDAIAMRADFVGLSFVRDAENVRRARSLLPGTGPRPKLVAKIETASAIDNLDEIVTEADGVMVARGDLAIQTSLRGVPLLQKEIIRVCNAAGVPVITATQVLESMVTSPIPTRAEIGDVANAVLDGTDALMLSEETAVGRHPAACVRIMGEVAEHAEQSVAKTDAAALDAHGNARVAAALAHAAVSAAEEVRAAAILCHSRVGEMPQSLSMLRPRVGVIALTTPDGGPSVAGSGLFWGVRPLPVEDGIPAGDVETETQHAVGCAVRAGAVAAGDRLVVVGGPGHDGGDSGGFLRIVRA